jgi:hypothetical protein
MKTVKPFIDASARIYTGQSKNKSLIHMAVRKLGTVPSALGEQTSVVVEVYGECRSCNEKVSFGKALPNKQWVPLKLINDEDGIYHLHRCEGELKRNAALRRLVYGEQKVHTEQD